VVGQTDTYGLATRVALEDGRLWVVQGETSVRVLTDCQTVFLDDCESGDPSAWAQIVSPF